jgi:Fungal Zn(2)-Cys(6) binuclear cluster domain
MQHTRLPNFPFHFPSFKNHRSSLESRFTPHLTLPKPAIVPAWASLPTPPMSGSPPPEPPSDPPQIVGRRRKRSETPPTTTAPAALSPPTPLEHSAQSTATQPRGGQPGGEIRSQSAVYASSYPPPPVTYGPGVPMGVLATTPPDTLFAAGQVSPKAVRKTKAHVASACVNCKKKHLRCDNARPCRRCVQGGKEVSDRHAVGVSLLTTK